MREKSWLRDYGLILLTGAAVGIAALVLTAAGNPKNMGFCIACFLRDIAGAAGAAQRRRCPVRPAGDHRHRAGRHGGGPGGEGVPGQGRVLPRLPLCDRRICDDRRPGVPGLSPADGHPPGGRRPDRRGGPGRLHRRHPHRRGVPAEGLLPGPGLPRPVRRGRRPAGDHDPPAGPAAGGAGTLEVLRVRPRLHAGLLVLCPWPGGWWWACWPSGAACAWPAACGTR